MNSQATRRKKSWRGSQPWEFTGVAVPDRREPGGLEKRNNLISTRRSLTAPSHRTNGGAGFDKRGGWGTLDPARGARRGNGGACGGRKGSSSPSGPRFNVSGGKIPAFPHGLGQGKNHGGRMENFQIRWGRVKKKGTPFQGQVPRQ